MEKLNKILSWGFKMAKKILAESQCSDDNLPIVILLPSENTNIDMKQRSEEIKYYLTQILLLAHKNGRPSKKLTEETQNAA